MVSKPTDKKDCLKDEYTSLTQDKTPLPEAFSPAMTQDYGKKNDADLTNGFVPQVRKN